MNIYRKTDDMAGTRGCAAGVGAGLVFWACMMFLWAIFDAASTPRPVDVTCENYYGTPVECP